VLTTDRFRITDGGKKTNIGRRLLSEVEQALESGCEVSEPFAQNGLDAFEELLELSEKAHAFSQEADADTSQEPMLVNEVVEQTVSTLEREYPRASFSTSVTTQQWLPGSVQLSRALRELCENAIDHTTASSPSVAVTAETTDETHGWVTISVVDNGPGIPEMQHAVLGRGEETDLVHASGLGLWIVHWIVASAGGELSLTDDDGTGATVTMRLPTVGHDGPSRDGQVVVSDHE